jgi:dinuclear metal center YbgI/SA1388 family protein
MARQPVRRPRPQAPVGRTRRAQRTPGGKPSSVGALAEAMESVAPARLAEPWDNVGLLLGDRSAPCGRVLVAVDWTAAVLEEALALGVDAVVCYHPPIFDALKRLCADDPRQRTLLEAAQAGIALLSPHTALDAVQGGVNDWLAEGIAGGADKFARGASCAPLRPAAAPGEGAGRLLVLRAPATVREIASRLRRHLGVKRIECTSGGVAKHQRIALCPGAGASFLQDASAHGATLLVTGEARHHEHLAAQALGITMLLPGHTQTERGYMPTLARRLARALPGVDFTTSQSDLPPLVDVMDAAERPAPAARPRRPLR